MDERAPRRVVAIGAAVVAMVLIESLRVWLPSVLLALGDAGATPAPILLAFTLATFAVAPLAATQLHRMRPATVWIGGGALLALGRAALLLTDGGPPQAGAATVAVVGGTLAITAIAAGATPRDRARTGVLVGLAAATALHAGTRTLGLVWRDGVAATVLSLLLVAVLLATVRHVAPQLGVRQQRTTHATAWPWLVLTPLLLLVGQVSGVPGRVAVVTGWDAPVVATTVAGAHVGAVLAALLAPRLGPVRSGRTGAAMVLVGTAAALQASGWPGVAGPVVLAIGLGLIVGAEPEAAGTEPLAADTGDRTRDTVPTATGERRRGQFAATALLIFGIVTVLSHLAYEIRVPIDNRWMLLGLALAATSLGIASAHVGRTATTRAQVRPIAASRVVGIGVLVVALVGVGARTDLRDPPESPDDGRLRVALHNARSGYDAAGRFEPIEQARVLRAYTPDVVVVNEVDRGWLITGGHDALELLASELGLPHVTFAGAADEVWGNAVLSRYPIVERSAQPLPTGSDPMTRGELAVLLDVDGQHQLGVVATQLSDIDSQGDTRLPQARSVAGTVARFRERQVPTVVAGDLAAEPGSQELATFGDLVASIVPPGTPTSPAGDPEHQTDHVLASSDLRRVSVQVPDVRISDRRPVIVTLELDVSSDDG